MRVRNLIEALQKLPPEAEVSIYTGWEGDCFMTPEGVDFFPEGLRGHKCPTVLIHRQDPPQVATLRKLYV